MAKKKLTYYFEEEQDFNPASPTFGKKRWVRNPNKDILCNPLPKENSENKSVSLNKDTTLIKHGRSISKTERNFLKNAMQVSNVTQDEDCVLFDCTNSLKEADYIDVVGDNVTECRGGYMYKKVLDINVCSNTFGQETWIMDVETSEKCI